MTHSIEELVARYDGCYRKAERMEVEPARFQKGIERGDGGAFGVGALVVRDGCGLFVREGTTWLLPGGRLGADETFESGARREVREETGIEIEITELGAIAEQTFTPTDSDESYEFRFITFIARPSNPIPELPDQPADRSVDEIAWHPTVPESTFDHVLVRRLFQTYV